MGVHVDEMISEVTTEPNPTMAVADKRIEWEEEARIREAQAQLARDRFRTAAEGYDD